MRERTEIALRWAATLAIATAGGAAAVGAGLPVPWMLGPMLACGFLAATRVRVLGRPPSFPPGLRQACVPVIGVLIGSAVTPDLLSSALDWWPTLLSVALFVPLAHFAGYQTLRRAGGYDRRTAFFGSMPGGMLEAIELGRKNGADLRAVTSLQFSRVALVVMILPVAFSIIEGRAVGSAAGASFGAAAALTLKDVAILTACGAGGLFLGARLRVPAGQIVCPLFASAVAHAAGWTSAAPPVWLSSIAQLVIGASLGIRFVGLSGRELARHMGFSALNVAAVLAIGLSFALIAQALGGASAAAMALALAPGGVVEMGLVALSLQTSPIFVTAHHVVRIVLTVAVAVTAWRRLRSD